MLLLSLQLVWRSRYGLQAPGTSPRACSIRPRSAVRLPNRHSTAVAVISAITTPASSEVAAATHTAPLSAISTTQWCGGIPATVTAFTAPTRRFALADLRRRRQYRLQPHRPSSYG